MYTQGATANHTDPDPSWTKVIKKRTQKVEMRKKVRSAVKALPVVTGVGTDANLKGSTPVNHIFVNRVDYECTEETMRRFLEKKGVKIINIHKTSKEHAYSASFRITVPKHQVESTLKADFWPCGIVCREWIRYIPKGRKPGAANDDAEDEEETDADDYVDNSSRKEHWYLDTDISKIAQYIDNVEVVGVSGMEDSQLISGRPYGGWGDFNTEMGRLRSAHTGFLTEFCSASGLNMCINHNVSSVDYTYENNCLEARSVIDHFILSENLNEEITLYCSLHEGDNTSDHNPVLLHLSVRIDHIPSDHPPTTSQNRVSWHRTSSRDILAYKEMLSVCLEVDKYYDDSVRAMRSSAEVTIPDAIFWNRIWVENGRPTTGVLSNIRRSTRAQYRRASRWVVRSQDKLSADRMAQALASNNFRDLWGEVKKKANKTLLVRWQTIVSAPFSCRNGIKQGGAEQKARDRGFPLLLSIDPKGSLSCIPP
ncbi:hypothetical protein CAPTEDRAFT_185528 [Capitella teleta]|uniref:Endonuclease/exonuclease/phosphatase domain-containing protein n=1 Tax=Capitella teleta TaxID=283909 RepID=R7TXY2_CAPTE|nr:hypothetical protein CAPTEDRAFT_185528 [Capitella teleta]|eukprot:ELT96286.1 hypothetical protein CAPTEDRAFT_185528 [Capitella teleta]